MMDEHAKLYLEKNLEGLRDITKGCWMDMHESDEQGLSAVVLDGSLDNAGGPDEAEVYLKRGGYGAWFKLATLIALARLAKI